MFLLCRSSIETEENEVIPSDINLISEVTTQDQSEQNLSTKEIQEKIDAKIQDQIDAEIQEVRDAEIQAKSKELANIPASNSIYPSLNHCDEPVSSILHKLATKTGSKEAERSLIDHNVKTIGDLSKLTDVKASALLSSNLLTIKKALRKFEKSLIKRGKNKYTEKKLHQNPSAIVEVCQFLFSFCDLNLPNAHSSI